MKRPGVRLVCPIDASSGSTLRARASQFYSEIQGIDLAMSSDFLKSVGLCSLYMAVGPSLVVLNKHILSEVGFRYPMLLSSLGLIFAALTAHILAAAGLLPIQKKIGISFWLQRVLPVGACHAATLAFGNAQYLYMGMALIQFLKAFTPIVVTAVAVVLLGKRPTVPVVASLALLCAGSSVTAAEDVSVTMFGVLLACGSASTEAVRLVLTQFVLQDCSFSLWESQYYLAPAAAVCLVSTGLYYEGGALRESGDLRLLAGAPLAVAGAASLGLGVQLLTAAVIQGPGAVTLKVLSQVRNAGLVLVGVVLYGEHVSLPQLLGYVVSLAAFASYNYFESRSRSAERSAVGRTKKGDGGGVAAADKGNDHKSSSPVASSLSSDAAK